MSTNDTKPLRIKSKDGKTGSRKIWNPFQGDIESFVKGIGYVPEEEKKIGNKVEPQIGNAISGIPSVFARANMVTYALTSGATDGMTFGMNAFYSKIIDEWKGLIAAFVLETNSQNWDVKRVELVYSDGDGTFKDVKNIYEPKGAFGNSLFNRTPLWEDQNEIGVENRKARPFIDIIYFDGKVVGGTSPETLVFTSPSYKFSDRDSKEKVYLDEITGKFTNPIKNVGKLTPEDLNKLYAYVSRLGKKAKDFYAKYEKTEHLYLHPNIKEMLYQAFGDDKGWLKEIKQYANEHKIELDKNKKPEVSIFKLEPFKSVFNAVNAYYANFEGIIFTEDDTRPSECIEFKLEDLLLDPNNTEIARIAIDDASNLPINLLRDQKTGAYFTIPLSPLGLKIFQREGKLEELIGVKAGKNSSVLTIESKPNSSGKPTLDVTLHLRKDDGTDLPPWTVTYNIAFKAVDPYETNQLVVWPNFASSYWKKYYLYSEMPHDQPTGWQVYPILGNIKNEDNVVELIDKELAIKIGIKKILPEKDFEFVRIAQKDQKDQYNDELGKILIGNIKTLSNFKYEIYESNKPIRGIELRYSDKSAGYIFLKYTGDQSKNSQIQLIKDKKPEGCRVGVDFGSNNTCIAFDNGENTELLEFQNRRISFFTSDEDQNRNNSVLPADTFEMLFFQNDPIWSNKIKSTITLHDDSRLINDQKLSNLEPLFGELVKGGFTSYEKNVAVVDSTDELHLVHLNKIQDQKIRMVHSMKWKEKDAYHKIAFIKNLILQTYAELFAGITGKTFYPSEVLWAFPAAMSNSTVSGYSNDVWDKIINCNPLNEAEFPLIVANQFKQKKGSSKGITGNSGGGMTGGGMTGGGMTGGGMTGGGMTGGGMTGGGMTGGGMTGGGMSGGGQQNTSQGNSNFIPAVYPEEIVSENAWKFTEPTPIDKSYILTESQAVAKYALQEDSLITGVYKVGVDVGGSTSDILLLTKIRSGKNVLVKQNSIKIAAGMLANATKVVPGFDVFLKRYAESNKSYLGEIQAVKNININTAPYCFNLILDRLDDEQKLNQFYKEIAANCKPLFWINIYLTGLTTYYLGIVCKKVSNLSEIHKDSFDDIMQKVIIDFYGKGARIYDWFKAYNKDTAAEYLRTCFNRGFGSEVPYDRLEFNNFSKLLISNKAVKVEVAKGLANPRVDLTEFDSSKMIGEVSGEDGYVLRIPGQNEAVAYTSLMEINPSLIQRLGSELKPSFTQGNAYPRFTDFMNIFYDYACNYLDFKFDGNEMLNAINKMNILQEVENDVDYQKAKKEMEKGREFDFVAPLLILEGQAFLKSYLLPKIKNS